jgi:hypothetical protein
MTFTGRQTTHDEEKSLRSVIASFHENALHKASLREAEVPQVAMFWVTRVFGRFVLLSLATPWPEAQQTMHYWNEPTEHIKAWPSYKKSLYLEGVWNDWPRGRVVYDQNRDVFTAFADPQLLTPYYKQRILQEFYLPLAATEFKTDLSFYNAPLQIPPALDPAREDPTV